MSNQQVLCMNYLKIYEELINSRKNLNRSKKTDHYELHHILPRCLGGSDEKENLVLLTPREHFLAHYLLWKIHNTRLMRDPLLYFRHANSRLYNIARISHIEEMKTNNPSLHLTEEVKERKRAKLRAHIKTKEHCCNISNAKKGKQPRLGAVLGDDSKKKISESLKDYFKNNEVSIETREKLRKSSTGRTHNQETLLLCKQKAKNRLKYKCPHCDSIMDAGNLKQHIKRKHDQ